MTIEIGKQLADVVIQLGWAWIITTAIKALLGKCKD